jgi:tetratricopeptide (TPR) repeat protein
MPDGDGVDDIAEAGRLVAAEEWSAALKALGPLRRADDSNAEVWRLQALALRGAGELTEAQFAADRWALLSPGQPDPLRLRADLLVERGKNFPAVEVAEELVTLDPSDVDAYRRLASSSRAAGLTPRARVAVTRALEIDPLRADTYELAGMIEFSAGQPAAAVDYFRQSLRLDPDNGRVAQQLQRALGAQSAKASGARQAAKQSKAGSKAHSKSVRSNDREEDKRRRKADRKLGVSRTPGDGSRRDKIVGALVLLLIVVLVVALRFR